LVVSQVKGEYIVKIKQMVAYLQLVFSLKSKFFRYDYKQISQSDKNYADSLANLGSTVEH